MKRLCYVFLFMLMIVFLAGCMNKEEKANEIIDYFDEVGMIEDDSKEDLGNYDSDVARMAKNKDVEGMIKITEDVIQVIKRHKKEIQQIELTFRATKKLQKLQVKLMDEAVAYYEWQLDVLKKESPKEELDEIMKEEKGLFGEDTERNHDSEYMKKANELIKTSEEFEHEIDYYWDIYHVGDYMD